MLLPEQWDAARRPWPNYCDGRHVYSRESGAGRCLFCGGPQRATEVYDNLAIERLHADLAAFERGER